MEGGDRKATYIIHEAVLVEASNEGLLRDSDHRSGVTEMGQIEVVDYM